MTSMKRIYLDHTATTPLDPRVMEAMLPYFSGTFGNASSIHAYGREAKEALERARAVIAQAIGAQPAEVFFTSGGTEADNIALCGVPAAPDARRGIVTAPTEHHAVLEPCRRMAARGALLTMIPVDAHGSVDPADLRAHVGPGTAVVSIMHANNETGTIAPLREIAAVAHAHGALLHTDAVQSAGKIPVNVRDLDVDMLSLSAHKMYGPKGIGALYVRRGVAVEPLMVGGGQERGRRPGTENVPLAVGFAEAFRLSLAEMAEETVRLRALRDALEAEISRLFPGVIVNGHPALRLPHVLNVSFGAGDYPLEGEMLVLGMDLEGVAVTSGSACTSGSLEPSHVILAMGRDAATARATLRFSFGRGNTQEDVAEAAGRLKRVVERMLAGRTSRGAPP